MTIFFGNPTNQIFAVSVDQLPSDADLKKLEWLFSRAKKLDDSSISGSFVGPRSSMVTPWSTNAVEMTQNMGIQGIKRIELFHQKETLSEAFDAMINQEYNLLGQDVFANNIEVVAVQSIEDIKAYNQAEGLALSEDEVSYLQQLSAKLERPLTDSEVFGFSQVNSEHCRHKIFNGTFVIDGETKKDSLFSLIKKTSKAHPNEIVSAYKDNVAFVNGPRVTQFAPEQHDTPTAYKKEAFDSVISLKAETHNFPTTVEPFSGAATGSGGEIRDRMAGGQGSIPLAGTAVYMTAYSRLNENRPWENGMAERQWLYRTPQDILIKASNGASDFGNKFGQPLIGGSLLTFEHEENNRKLAFDKVIMMAGGVGYGKKEQAIKAVPSEGDKIVILGGDNYRIGMGGAAVSSADTGAVGSGLELNAVQRSNPEMQKRVSNTVRALVESASNPIVSIHDHGAGGHLNCLSELVEDTGGLISVDKLPVGDESLSLKEIIGNESQERMGLVIAAKDIPLLQRIADRERAPMYVVGEVTGDHRFTFHSEKYDEKPMDLALSDMFGSSPKTIMEDRTADANYQEVTYDKNEVASYLDYVLKLEAVACKDWLTNKVDRCVGGRVAKQQCAGPLQLPLNNCAVMALDFDSTYGIATSIGHAPAIGLLDAAAGAEQSIVEALNNLIWAPLEKGLASVSLSANWMWPCRNDGEDARLYEAVSAVSEYCINLGINVPTGKDSMSMKQKYGDFDVLSPGTVIISSVGQCNNINKIVEPVLKKNKGAVYYISTASGAFSLGGSSFAQTRNQLGQDAPQVMQASEYAPLFNAIQKLISDDQIAAGHDISAGGLITCLLEMCFADNNLGADIDLSSLLENDSVKLLFSENAGLIIQSMDVDFDTKLEAMKIKYVKIGRVTNEAVLNVKNGSEEFTFDIAKCRDTWYETSYLLDKQQSGAQLATARYNNYKNQPLAFTFPSNFDGSLPVNSGTKPIAAIIREQGSNSERELAHALYLAGFEVRDVHMTDLISGRETLEDVRFLGAVGGFSNSDVLGSAKGWAGSFMYNEKARKSLLGFFSRQDVLSIGICNGCQLMVELDLVNPDHDQKAKMVHNNSGKHESAFTSVTIGQNNSVMLSELAGTNLGVWISHGEGKFALPKEEDAYNIIAKYGYDQYPSNPNGSDYNTAMMCSKDGRHLVTMPHIERSIFPWNWAHYPDDRTDNISPWIQAFSNARNWLLKN